MEVWPGMIALWPTVDQPFTGRTGSKRVWDGGQVLFMRNMKETQLNYEKGIRQNFIEGVISY